MNCPFCNKYFALKGTAIDHINTCHSESLSDGMNAEQQLYYSTHGTINGICMCGCGRPTKWNYKTGKPFKLTDDLKCRKKMRELAKSNHIKVYHTPTLLNDMDHQTMMLKSRHTSGDYKFRDGETVDYASKLELNFLKFCDLVVELSSNMIIDAPKSFTYYDDVSKRERQYIPDYYLPDYNLLVEIKEGGSHPNTNPAYIKETKYKEKLKDEVMRKQKEYNFIKIVDSNYGPFLEVLFNIVQLGKDDIPKNGRNAVIAITESACENVSVESNLSDDLIYPQLTIMFVKDAITNCLVEIIISESPTYFKSYITNDFNTLECPSINTKKYTKNSYIFIGDKKIETQFLNYVISASMDITNTVTIIDIFDKLSDLGIKYYFDDTYNNNNNHMSEFIKIK